MKKKKSPWLAAILNFIFPGVGYIYVGKRKIFSYLLIIGLVLSIIDLIYNEWHIPVTLLGRIAF